jgi:hypothetical protein
VQFVDGRVVRLEAAVLGHAGAEAEGVAVVFHVLVDAATEFSETVPFGAVVSEGGPVTQRLGQLLDQRDGGGIVIIGFGITGQSSAGRRRSGGRLRYSAIASSKRCASINLYGPGNFNEDLSGFSNAQVAAFYQSQFALPGSNLEAEVLATALNVYATTLSLGGTLGQAYGFSVTATGLGADSVNVGADGAAFGVANNSTRNVYQLLEAVNQQAVFGVLYNGDTTLRKEANNLFDALIQTGALA